MDAELLLLSFLLNLVFEHERSERDIIIYTREPSYNSKHVSTIFLSYISISFYLFLIFVLKKNTPKQTIKVRILPFHV